jgi:hypothetical protein
MTTVKRLKCSIEKSPYCDEVNTMLASGVSPNSIEQHMRALDYPMKRETIARHLVRCLDNDPAAHVDMKKVVGKTPGLPPPPAKMSEHDFAVAVQKIALRELAEGRLKVNTKDGLVAQQILDKRVERAKDREFVMNLARIISGAGQPPPDDVIEGEFTEEAVDEMLALMAPPAVETT